MSGEAPRVAYQGAPGAFSHEAAGRFAPGFDPHAMASFDAVFAAVEAGDFPRAVVPVENSLAGPVPEMAALLARSPLCAVGGGELPIRLALMATPGATLADLVSVESHPMALKQCGAFLRRHGLLAREAFDTAGAAQAVARAGDPTRAAVASPLAAALYGLTVLHEGIEDRADNRTRFVVLAR